MSLFKFKGSEPTNEYDFFAKKYNLPRPPRSLDDVKEYFAKFREGIRRGELLAMELGFRISYGACRKDIWKEHEAAKFIEEFISSFLGGILTSPGTRAPVSVPPVPEKVAAHLPDLRDFAQTVRRAALEKTDLYFPQTGLKISLKSLIPRNEELNVGSFQPRLLFAGLLPTIPEERKGMGSAKRLLVLFNQLRSEGKWSVFLERFKYMVDAIFDNIHFLVLERYPSPSPKLVVYIIESEKFRSLLKEKAEAGPEELTSIFYRFELHAMRLKKKPVIAIGDKIEIKLPDYEKNPLLRYLESVKTKYRQELLPGKIDMKDFKNEILSVTAKFLEEIEEMLKKRV